MLEGPRPCTSFVLCSLTIHELHNRNAFILFSCMSAHNYLLYYVRFCTGSTPKITNKIIQQRTLPDFLTTSLYKLWWSVKDIFSVSQSSEPAIINLSYYIVLDNQDYSLYISDFQFVQHICQRQSNKVHLHGRRCILRKQRTSLTEKINLTSLELRKSRNYLSSFISAFGT